MNFDWNDIEVFLAVARSGTLSAAGRQLNRSQPTIGRRIQQLEKQLSLTLFTRTPYGYKLTANGNSLIETAEEIQQKMDQLKGCAKLLNEQPSGVVNIACGESFARLLMDNMGRLTFQYPEISIQIQTGIQFVNLEKGEADIAIRSQRPTNPNLYVRFLGHCRYAVYASSAYVFQHPESRTERRAESCRWISYHDNESVLPVTRWLRQQVPPEQIKLYCSTLMALLQGVKSGQGLAALPIFVGKQSQDLIQLTPVLTDLNQETWLVLNRNAGRVQAIKAVSTWIGEIFDQLDDGCFQI